MLLDNANSFLDCQVIRLSAKEYYKVKEIVQNPLLYSLKLEESVLPFMLAPAKIW